MDVGNGGKNSPKSVRVVAVGDEGSGKSSVIKSFDSGCWVSQVPSVVGEKFVSAGRCPGKNKVSLLISDTKPRRDTLPLLKKADVILLVCDLTDEKSLSRVCDYWLPYFAQNRIDCPIVVALNKADLIEDSTPSGWGRSNYIEGIHKHHMVDVAVECSAKHVESLNMVFHSVQSAVLYPISPLQNRLTQKLRQDFAKALTRVFRLSDKDEDGLLNDQELDNYHFECYRSHINDKDIADIKTLLFEKSPECLSDGTKFVTFVGFLHLHQNSIEVGRASLCYDALKKFGYSKDLKLDEENYVPKIPDGSVDQNCELTESAVCFLIRIFLRFDEDQDGGLSPQELAHCFEGSPKIPFPKKITSQVQTNESGYIDSFGWLSVWSMLALLQPSLCMIYLTYLGYPVDGTSPMRRASAKSLDKRCSSIDKNIVHCYLFGSRGCGKTTFCNRLIRKSYFSQQMLASDANCVANVVDYDEDVDAKKVVVITEVPSIAEVQREMIADHIPNSDLIILMYDLNDAHSLQYVVDLLENSLPSYVPILFVASKHDLDEVEQLTIDNENSCSGETLDITDICKKFDLPYPLVSQREMGSPEILFCQILETALNPAIARPSGQNWLKKWFKRGGTMLMLMGIIFGAYKVVSARTNGLIATRKASSNSPGSAGPGGH